MTKKDRKQLDDLIGAYGAGELLTCTAEIIEDAFRHITGPVHDRAMQNAVTLRNTANIIHKN